MHLTTLTLALTLLLPLGGCDFTSLPELDRSGELALDEADPADHRRGPPPPVALLHLAMDLGDLHEDPTMTEAWTTMTQRHDESHAAQQGLLLAVAAVVETGSISADAFTAELDVLEATARAEGEAVVQALNTAHAQLDEELRMEVVDALPEPGPPDGSAPPPRGPQGEGHRPPPGPDVMLLKALELDQSQHDALRAALGEPSAPPPPPMLDLSSFADEDFDATALGLDGAIVSGSTQKATRQLEFLAALVPLLDGDQRMTLVELLSEGPPEPKRNALG